MRPTDSDIELLRLIAVSGLVTTKEIEAQESGIEDIKGKCDRLWSNHFLNADRVSSKPPIYSISSKGRRLLAQILPKEMGEFPQPRRFVPDGSYSPKPIATRPGSDAFLKCPSRRGDVLVPHALPLSMAGGGE